MNTQTTPVHIRLWHHEFWMLVVADLLLTMSVYMLIPVFPQWLMDIRQMSPLQTGLSMAAFALGLYLLGPQCSWLVQHYRRNKVFMWAAVAVTVNMLLLSYFQHLTSFLLVLLHRVALGAAFGMAQMVLTSTLIIDTCESHQRTEANYGAAWFSRFALSLGPVVALALMQMPEAVFQNAFVGKLTPPTAVFLMSAVVAFASILLISRVSFPFRSPEECVSVASLDRFFLPNSYLLFFNLLLVGMVTGMVMTLHLPLLFYAEMMGGFLLALLAQRFVFKDAELESEVVSGLILMTAALLVLMVYPQNSVAPLLMGLAIGLVNSRFLLLFVKLSRHCQRGTSQSTFFLSWETGLALGLGVGYACCYDSRDALFYTALALTAVALLMYHLLTHPWFLKHKNR